MPTPEPLETRFLQLIAGELGCHPGQVEAADRLFAEGSTVPFVARYRKEATGGLDDEALETLAKRREYFLDLAERRDSILATIEEQGKLSDDLAAALRKATTKQELEDLYLPYKPKRRTRAELARQRGLEPLARALVEGARRQGDAVALAEPYIDPEASVEDAAAALAGARDILAEELSEAAANRVLVRSALGKKAVLEVQVQAGKEKEGEVYRDYFDYREPAAKLPSHRILAILRGEKEGFLRTHLAVDDDALIQRLTATWGVPLDGPCGQELREATADGYRRLLRPAMDNERRNELREAAEAEAIAVFRANLEALLLQAPLGQVSVLGVDPGYRTGCKLALCDPTGRVQTTAVIHPVPPKADLEESTRTLLALLAVHPESGHSGVDAVAIGNGTGSRETELFVRGVVKEHNVQGVIVAIVPETGASVYSASEVAREELPDHDVAMRGAVSIARRLQDPLAELVKIEPRSLGVGQYQHDVDQKALGRELDLAVVGAVNRVGVELNTASRSLLTRVSGLGPRLARAVIHQRDQEGPFASRRDLLEVPGLGPKTFEQAAGFLRIRGGDEPLDATAVHPERYSLVKAMAQKLAVPVGELVGRPELVAELDFQEFEDRDRGIGTFTLEDIREELLRPGRDPRPTFAAPAWRDDVQSLEDLEVGMVLEGRVSNVTNFGAFVDIGVKRDGLVHLSELSHDWVEDPRLRVKVGDVIKVQVKEVERDRGRIGLSMKSLEDPRPTPRPAAPKGRGAAKPRRKKPPAPRATVDDLMRRFNRPL